VRPGLSVKVLSAHFASKVCLPDKCFARALLIRRVGAEPFSPAEGKAATQTNRTLLN